MMRILVTGATGFAGSYLVESLLADGHDVSAVVHPETGHQPLPKHANFKAVMGDLLDLPSLRAAFRASSPEQVYHLAGQASPGLSWADPAATLAINAGGTANVLEAARSAGLPRVLIVTSSHLYGSVAQSDLPIDEETSPDPRDPYGVSKWAAARLAPVYWHHFGLPVIEARPFNHIGPRQAKGFVVPDFASQVAAVKLRHQSPEIRVGNLDVQRDFTDVRDVVRAYRLLLETGRPGQAYVICSGRGISIRSILDHLIELSGCRITVTPDPELIRPTENPRIVGTYHKIFQETGWEPAVDLRQSLKDTLDDWVARQSQ